MGKCIAVSGNLGVGKTTFVKKIGGHCNWSTMFESVSDNPYLSDYYTDMNSWAFHLQIYFITNRVDQYLKAIQIPQTIIADRSIYEDVNVFLPALYHLGALSKRDYDTITQLYMIIQRYLPPPDLLIYMTASVDIIMQRIQKRGLGFDYDNITKDYLELIQSYYDKWIKQYRLSPVMSVDTTNSNYLDDKYDLINIVDQIKDKI